MAIKSYVKDGQNCYLIRYTATSRIANASARGQRDLGAVSHSEAKIEHAKLKRHLESLRAEKERCGLRWNSLLQLWYRREIFDGERASSTTKIDAYNTLQKHTKSFMKVPIEQLRPMSINLIFEDMRKQGLSRSRMKTVRGAINSVFDWAILNRIIPPHMDSPARGVRLPKVEVKKQPILNREEIRILLRKARELKHGYYYLWAVALNTGCRSGELWALKWSDIDFERRMISVTKSFSSRLGSEKSTKTNEWRDIPINPQLETLLKELRLITGRTGYVLPRITSWRRGEASKVLRDFCQVIGIREINFHATRACFAVQCLESGVDIPTTMKLGGWNSLKSFQHYLRLAGVEVKGATDCFNFMPAPEITASVIELKPQGV